MKELDVGLCLEFTVETDEETFVVLERPATLNQMIDMLTDAHAESLRAFYHANRCFCTHLYVNGRSELAGDCTSVEYSLSNDEENGHQLYVIT